MYLRACLNEPKLCRFDIYCTVDVLVSYVATCKTDILNGTSKKLLPLGPFHTYTARGTVFTVKNATII